MIPLIVIGNVSLDEIILGNVSYSEVPGGGAFHLALAASLTGCRTYLVGRVGADFPFDKLTRPESLKLDLLSVLPGLTTRFQILYSSEGEMVAVSSEHHPIHPRDANLLPTSLLAKHVHISCKVPFSPHEYISRIAASSVSTDVSISSLRQQLPALLNALQFTDFLFLNLEEYLQLINVVDLAGYPRLYAIVSNGPETIRVIHRGELLFKVPSYPTKASDPTGAGDVLAGSCLGMMSFGKSLWDSLVYGSAMASICVEAVGSQHLNSVVREEVDRRMNWISSQS